MRLRWHFEYRNHAAIPIITVIERSQSQSLRMTLKFFDKLSPSKKD
jgi:hypothetical protein